MFAGCIHLLYASARRRPAAVAERDGQSAAGRVTATKADEKAKINFGARMVIGRQKTVAGPLLNISHQRAPHQRYQGLPELSEDASGTFRRDPGKNNTSHRETRHEVPLCPTTWTEAVSDSETSSHWGHHLSLSYAFRCSKAAICHYGARSMQGHHGSLQG